MEIDVGRNVLERGDGDGKGRRASLFKIAVLLFPELENRSEFVFGGRSAGAEAERKNGPTAVVSPAFPRFDTKISDTESAGGTPALLVSARNVSALAMKGDFGEVARTICRKKP